MVPVPVVGASLASHGSLPPSVGAQGLCTTRAGVGPTQAFRDLVLRSHLPPTVSRPVG